jgi:hypothetical protein
VTPVATPVSPSISPGSGEQILAAANAMNPEISVILDLNFHVDDAGEGISHVREEMLGFGHAHGDHGHQHGVSDGFNMSHLELQFTAEADPYARGTAIVAVSEDGAELEVAELQTTSLPYGLSIEAGKFFSDFSAMNAKHAHAWDFTDAPLIHQLLLGDHGLNEVGAQLSWLAPTPFFLLAGVEALQGKNENLFAYSGEAPLKRADGPRVGLGWLKFGPNLPGHHGLQIGLFAGKGTHQEAHDGNDDGMNDHFLNGHSTLWGGDFLYKFDAPRPYGQGDLTLQGGYLRRVKDLTVREHLLNPALIGNQRRDEQDGLYLQATYGFLPRWRAGLRWDQVGLVNRTELPDNTRETHPHSHRLSGMLDFSTSEFSRLRLQASRGAYATDEGRPDVTEFWVQWILALGSHGAHTF